MGTRNVGIERTPDGRRLVATQYVDAPREQAWEMLIDTERWVEWGPSVRAVDCASRFITTGTRGRVKTPLGVWMPFEVTDCGDFRWTWRVAKIPATGHRVEEADGGCRVGFEVPLVAAGYLPVCLRAVEKIAENVEAESVETS